MKKIMLLLVGMAVWTATTAVAVALAETAPTTPTTAAAANVTPTPAAHQPKAGDLPKPTGETKAAKKKAAKNAAADSAQPAKKQQPISIKFDVRADWEYHRYREMGPADESGFAGKFLNFILDGNISDQFSYHFRYRFNKFNTFQDFFEATDWAYLNYDINKNWRLSAGKQVIAIGGYEYDKAPIDVYFYSDFCNNLPACYEFGISGQYTTNDGRNTILFQISNSPFTSKSIRFEGLYAYNLMWYGNYGVFNSMYSVNLIEYKPNHYINYIALGNQFNAGPVCIELDYTNRYGGGKNFFNDFTVVGKVNYNILNRVNIFFKGGFDYNNAQTPTVIPPDIKAEDMMAYLQSLYYYDLAVLPGTNYGFYGAGVEFFPMKNSHNVRLHAYWCSSTANTKAHNVGIGFRWRLNAFERE